MYRSSGGRFVCTGYAENVERNREHSRRVFDFEDLHPVRQKQQKSVLFIVIPARAMRDIINTVASIVDEFRDRTGDRKRLICLRLPLLLSLTALGSTLTLTGNAIRVSESVTAGEPSAAKAPGIRLRSPELSSKSGAKGSYSWSADGVIRSSAPRIVPLGHTGSVPAVQGQTPGGFSPQSVPEVPVIPSLDEAAGTVRDQVAPEFDIIPETSSRDSVIPEFDLPPRSYSDSGASANSGHSHSPQGDSVHSHTAPQPSTGRFVPGPRPGTSGFRATVETDAPQWLGGYMGRTEQIPADGELTVTTATSVQIPPDYQPWWDSLVRSEVGIAPQSVAVDVNLLVQRALQFSPQVLALQAEPEVQQRVVWQEQAAFDWRAFLDTTYDDLNDPVGNTLTTGNNSRRSLDERLSSSAGLKKRTTSGGELSLSQRIGNQQNNSIFLQPNPQSTSRLELSFRQPLLGKAGTVYSQNQIVLAQIATNTAGDEVLTELQSHLYKVTEAYWQLYRARAEFFQRQKLLSSAKSVLQTLEGRHQVDTIPRQTLRARAAVARAESRMQRAVTSIRNAESQIRLLVNDPDMLNNGPIEFTPTETPVAVMSPSGLRDALQTALINRPDISRAIRQMRASSVRLGVSRNELLPKLDFIVKTYVAGLEAQNQIPQAVGNQFSQGGPGYTVGFEFEVPLGNRAAKARVEQRQWELQRSINVFRATVETSLTDVEVANREVETSWREMAGRFQAMEAAQNETNYLSDRFDVLPMAEESAILLLEDLLDGFERLADEESAFVESQVNYALSIIQLRRATGVLLRSRHEQAQLLPDESEWMETRAQNHSGIRARHVDMTDSESLNSSDIGTGDRDSEETRSSETSGESEDSIPTFEVPEAEEHEEEVLNSGDDAAAKPISIRRILPNFGSGKKARESAGSSESKKKQGGHSLIR
ncbi:MAG: TolC family protein [Planctomyces sp.]